MKTRFTLQSTFFNHRALLALPVLAGVLWALSSLPVNPAAAGGDSAARLKQKNEQRPTGTLEKMMVTSGSVSMNLDLGRLNGVDSAMRKAGALHFTVQPNSFFTILVFNNLLRAAEPGSMPLIGQGAANLPAGLSTSLGQLVLEKTPRDVSGDMIVRDGKTGFVFFNVEGNQYDYDGNAQLLTITGGRLLISKEFANVLQRPSDAGSTVGNISVGAAMQSIQITQLVNGKTASVVMPPLQGAVGGAAPALVPGPDVIVGDLPDLEQFGSAGTQVGLGLATDACNNGDQPINWFAFPNTDHPVVPQNLYRMSGGADNTMRFEQIAQSWMKHTFGADESDACGFGCNTNACSQGVQLCPGCSDLYFASTNADQNSIGSRAWVNPFTGSFPSNANDHSGHIHDGVSHRILVEVDDLNQTLNQGATYFAEGQYVTPHEYTWCQAHPGQCNMFNNASYRQFLVSGTANFTFSPVGSTVRMQPAINAYSL